jgi:sec-independent protein translocase protein TatC
MSNNIISDKTKTIEDDNKENENIDSKESSMSFLGHIEELRKRVLISIIGVVVGCVISGIFINQILENIFLKPAIDNGLYLQNLVPFGQPFLYFKVILAVGIIISIPFTLYQL